MMEKVKTLAGELSDRPVGLDVVIVGNRGGTNVAQSLLRGADSKNIRAMLVPAQRCLSSLSLLNSLSWRVRDKRPPHDGRLTQSLRALCTQDTQALPRYLITTGIVPVYRDSIRDCRCRGIVSLHFATDDPWNRSTRSRWYFNSLPEYDVIFTPRYSAIDDFRRLSCRQICYLPFGYDPFLFGPDIQASVATDAPEVLFVGGADKHRTAFFEDYFSYGGEAGLVGAYWERSFKPNALGHRSPADLAALTRSAKVNLILVRRANRDGHVMRSFEAAALGGCLLAEDTPEHREMFGEDGECVRYFSSPEQAAHRAQALLRDASERERLALAVQRRVVGGANTYGDRLKAMLTEANATIARREHAA